MSINAFQLQGTVKSVETRTSKKGNQYFVLTILAGNEEVPIPYFSNQAPNTGDKMTFEGQISSYKGYLNLKPTKSVFDRPNNPVDAKPAAQPDISNTPEGDPQLPELPELPDDELPF